MRARDTAYFESYATEPQTFSSLPVFRPVLSKGASKISVAFINVAINFGYEYFCYVICFSNIFSQNFLNIFFFRALLSMPPCLQRQNWLYASVL